MTIALTTYGGVDEYNITEVILESSANVILYSISLFNISTTIQIQGEEDGENWLDSVSVTIYSYKMSKTDKLMERLRSNQDNLDLADFETLLARLGWVFDRQTGSHRMWISPKKARLVIQPQGSKAKGYQIRQFLRIYNEEESNE